MKMSNLIRFCILLFMFGGCSANKANNYTKDEQDLVGEDKNLCVYVGKTEKKSLDDTTIVKHHYCCWENLLEKTIQVEARKQLNMDSRDKESGYCRSLTLKELGRVDFSKIDFSEVISEMQKKIALSNKKDKDIERLRSEETMRAIIHIKFICSGYEDRATRLIDEGKITQTDDLTISKEVQSLKSICPYYSDIWKKFDVREDVERFLQFELFVRKAFKQKPNFKKSKALNS